MIKEILAFLGVALTLVRPTAIIAALDGLALSAWVIVRYRGTKLLAVCAFVAAICIASMGQAAVPRPDRPMVLSAEQPIAIQPAPTKVKTKRCYSQVYRFGDDVLTVVRCEG
ncbi:hypothetical protein GCM10011491_30740 [Brucella endophytica]|uniref:Uncharacterized protein n=1 Tax=Brucella endophytica TaxID=1963359 RepID=A0A916WIF7_9HYPH|nr:hypothetical protein [Brucella endophytica]GGB00394.1 hypothetical protein GCM10011491_30740 [Brucella endophytica]